jgi:hypothetical protein
MEGEQSYPTGVYMDILHSLVVHTGEYMYIYMCICMYIYIYIYIYMEGE